MPIASISHASAAQVRGSARNWHRWGAQNSRLSTPMHIHTGVKKQSCFSRRCTSYGKDADGTATPAVQRKRKLSQASPVIYSSLQEASTDSNVRAARASGPPVPRIPPSEIFPPCPPPFPSWQ